LFTTTPWVGFNVTDPEFDIPPGSKSHHTQTRVERRHGRYPVTELVTGSDSPAQDVIGVGEESVERAFVVAIPQFEPFRV
jgi:hypothetical protein